ncbi:hypothetical protein AMATHDRAFT_64951 [Amanita thiersii Skay4041]|uniref:ribonuclease Z n=1 Tax=Amanita thiersii Skay4041 TaxID=703135 RepID=A0A2A9NK24_9AGAR|nr:hypothetical protein AMATHDRAFT_64951 [Amanita thiersii Skay4041]
MNWSTSVLSSISSDTEPTIVITFDSAKYIFNVGENTTRSFLSGEFNWKRARALFLTQLGPKRTGGLPGFLMTLADGGIPDLRIAGPYGLLHRMASMRMYTYRDTMLVEPLEAPPLLDPSPDAIYKDENIIVYGFPLYPTDPSTPTTSTLKRKRSGSPTSPSKRLHPSPRVGSPQDSPVYDQTPTHDFSTSTSLSGRLAQEWRKSMIQHQFPFTRKHELSHNRERRKKIVALKMLSQDGKGKSTPMDAASSSTDASITDPDNAASNDGESTTGNSRSESSRTPARHGHHLQLPPFSYTGPGTPTSPPTLAYLIVGPRIRGKFNAAKAQKLGIPSGPIRQRLINGQPITFKTTISESDGDTVRKVEIERTVQPEECVDKSETPDKVILVLDVPSPSYIPSVISTFETPFYAKFRSRSPEYKEKHIVRTVYHILGEGVLEDERYIQFMRSFEEPESNGEDPVHHLVASPEYCADPITFTSAAFNQLRLNTLDDKIFPLPKFTLKPSKDISSVLNLPPSTHVMTASHSIKLRPFEPPEILVNEKDKFHPAVKGLTPNSLPPTTAEKFAAAKQSVENAELEKRRQRGQRGSWSEGEGESESESESEAGRKPSRRGKDVGVLPLGTGSAMPTKYRNVSSTLITIPGWGNVLLDAGEGTWGQLVRHFGRGRGPKSGHATGNQDDVWQMLRNLKCIFISHIHGDHHLGLATILTQRKLLDPPPEHPLFLVSIRGVHLYLREMSDLEDLGIDMDLPLLDRNHEQVGNGVATVISDAMHFTRPQEYQASGLWQVGGVEPWLDITRSKYLAKQMCRQLGLYSFSTVDMHHGTKCLGLVMKHKDQWSLVFSGDTTPKTALARVGYDATLLIHEATMADDQEELAKQRCHSTVGQAVQVGKNMNARHILLTHFSARYPKMPPSAVGTAKPDDDNDEGEGGEEGKQAVLEPPRRGSPSGHEEDWSIRNRARSRQQHKKPPVIAIAFDHLNLTIGDMWKVNHYLSAIGQCLADTAAETGGEEDEGEERTLAMMVDNSGDSGKR